MGCRRTRNSSWLYERSRNRTGSQGQARMHALYQQVEKRNWFASCSDNRKQGRRIDLTDDPKGRILLCSSSRIERKCWKSLGGISGKFAESRKAKHVKRASGHRFYQREPGDF